MSQPPLPPPTAVSVPAAWAKRSVTVIVPTYEESENFPELIQRLEAVRTEHDLDLSVLIMDDASPDGTPEAVAALGRDWVELVTRTTNRGLSPAVIDGIRRATSEVILVMDADLSHPPEAIPAMLEKLQAGHDFVIGSRYTPGGSTDEAWGVGRWLNSKIATWLARPLTRVSDPMAGFFAMRRADVTGVVLNPVGYKIGLELMIKCDCESVAEQPIHFAQRTRGQSKLNLGQQLRYIQHLRRLFLHKYPNRSYMLQFAVVGAIGLGVNLAVLTVLLAAGVPAWAAVAVAIVVSMLANFGLNRRFTFSYARGGNLVRQMLGYFAACSVGAGVNYLVALAVLWSLPTLWPQAAATLGVLAGMGFNYTANRYLVFRRSPAPAVTVPPEPAAPAQVTKTPASSRS